MIAQAVDDRLTVAAETFGTPCFVYLTDAIEDRILQLRSAFGGRLSLSYAVKSNPNPALLRWMNGRVDALDVSSIGEFRLALRAGWNPERIGFTGPAKRDAELAEAIGGGVGELVIESVREAVAADRIARSMGVTQNALVRIAPATVPKGFGDTMAGRPSAFGIDWEDTEAEVPRIMALPNLRVIGLHIYSGTQCLRPDALVENYRSFLGIFRALCARHEMRPAKLVLGSGLGVPYHDEDEPIDLGAVASGIAGDLDALRGEPRFSGAQLVLELGRYLVAEAGFFVTRVVSTKLSRGVRIAICDGGMNNHLPASGHFGMVMRRNYSMHKVGARAVAEREKVDLVGPLCTSIDRLGSGVPLPPLSEGDLIAIHNSGAYGLTASPVHFISHGVPAEVMEVDDRLRDVSRRLSDTDTATSARAALESRGEVLLRPADVTSLRSPRSRPRRFKTSP